MGMQYGLMGRNGGASASPAGANGFQQGLWAPSFGSPMTSAGYGFNSASATPGKNALHDNKSPQMQFAGNNGAGKDFSGDYRYSNQQGSYQYPQQFRQQQNMYGHVGYGGHAHGGHGFGQQMANRGSHGQHAQHGPHGQQHAGGRFPNHSHMGQGVMNGVSGVDYQMAYDPSYYQGQYGNTTIQAKADAEAHNIRVQTQTRSRRPFQRASRTRASRASRASRANRVKSRGAHR
ncbi:hypothetical protein A1Q2_01570 [Trichosporon asahii var. asahii CBS 8904]|uniref:Uncharacterized protein n=1 Tax=Trichosporon asahii var. asahii (strain CBS 8904) TaxID=1220162 RepID=K1VJ23_TRIAC|nr:hypothetical protein A1Q2_01570 [Trichosporon asahii var. asahii CBS 8904]